MTGGSETDRRDFLRRAIFGTTGIATGAFGGVAGGYLIGGAGSHKEARWVPLIRISELAPGEPRQIHYRDLVSDAWRTTWRSGSVWLVRREEAEDITVFRPQCPHMGCPYEWKHDEGVFRCGCHGGIFDIEGLVIAGPPPRPLDRLESKVVGEQLTVKTGGLWDETSVGR